MKAFNWVLCALATIALLLSAPGRTRANDTATSPVLQLVPRIHAAYPHDREAFTQGLLWDGHHLLESTGLNGRSSVRRVDLTTGLVLQKFPLEDRHFGEGLTLHGGRLYQITWRTGTCIVYDPETFAVLQTHEYRGEGWGLANNGTHLLMTDGSHLLQFRDPETFEIVRVLPITNRGRNERGLNELEFVDGFLWANVFMTDRIVKIDLASGRVVAEVNAAGLLAAEDRQGVDVLNGIAWKPETRRFLITGKLWPRLFEVEFVAAPVAKAGAEH